MTAEDLIIALNEAIALDAQAVEDLLLRDVPCSPALAKHLGREPREDPGLALHLSRELSEDEDVLTVRALDLLLAVFGPTFRLRVDERGCLISAGPA